MVVKKTFSFLIIFFVLTFVLGCSKNNTKFNQQANKKNNLNWSGFLFSEDGGKQWEMRNKAGEKSIAGLDILSLETTSQSYPPTIYIGTKKYGIFKSNLGDDWKRLKSFPAVDVYGLAAHGDTKGNDVITTIYASGTENKRGKIYISKDLGDTWKEIYTEPAEGIKVLSLTVNSKGWIYAGDSDGSLFRSKNEGSSWENLYSAQAPIINIKIDQKNNKLIYLLLWKKTALFSVDDGKTFNQFNQSQKLNFASIKEGELKKPLDLGNPFSLALDSNQSGVVYLGTDKGIFKSFNNGKELEKINTLSSSDNYPIRALIVSPFNSKKIIYAAAKAIYFSDDGGETWGTFQLNTNKVVGQILFSKDNPEIIYAGMKKVK